MGVDSREVIFRAATRAVLLFDSILLQAVLLALIGASSTVVAAGLLHDTLDDSFMASDNLLGAFGARVADLVEGVSNLSHLSKLASDNDTASKSAEADRLHTMFLAMADARAVLIKIGRSVTNGGIACIKCDGESEEPLVDVTSMKSGEAAVNSDDAANVNVSENQRYNGPHLLTEFRFVGHIPCLCTLEQQEKGAHGGLCSTLFIANLGPNCTEIELKQAFSVYRGFNMVKMRSRGGMPVAFADYAETEEATKAMQELQGSSLSSSDPGGMHIEYARRKMSKR
ncbi:hypothetical protein K1719_023385 [Acacia pycnantha]|nr:hypothetical protein K1719_023385 [Acacia pycnantha]